jgi:hypothetical protein
MITVTYAEALVNEVNRRLRAEWIDGRKAPIYGSNYPYGRPVVAVSLEAADGAIYGRVIATEVYGLQYESERFFDEFGQQIFPVDMDPITH